MELTTIDSFDSATRPVARRRPRRKLRRMLRGYWLSMLLIPALLSIGQITGLFGMSDGRFFDAVSTAAAGQPPRVVIVERDAAFEARGSDRFGQLQATLHQLGIARTGYLQDIGPAARAQLERTSTLPAVIAVDPQPLADGSGYLAPGPASHRSAAINYAPRSLAPAQYGIYRRQYGALPSPDGPMPTFDGALAGVATDTGAFFIRMPRRQSIPRLNASQIDPSQFAGGELAGMVALVTRPQPLHQGLTSPLTPATNTTDRALLHAYAINTLRSGGAVRALHITLAVALLFALTALLAAIYQRIDPKRFAVSLPLGASLLTLASGWAALQFGNVLLPVSAAAILPWIVSYDRILWREGRQDLRLEAATARAVSHSFKRSALREAANLPDYFSHASGVAGLDRYLALELDEDGGVSVADARNADFGDIALSGKPLLAQLAAAQDRASPINAAALVPGWQGTPLLAWLGGADSQYFWLFEAPAEGLTGRPARLVRAFMVSFREIFQWRRNLNARNQMDERVMPIDERVAGAISLVATESEQIRHGFDMTQSAVGIFHLIGAPLHANAPMQAIYRHAGLPANETALADVVAALTDLTSQQSDAMISELVLNGGEMCLPMRRMADADRMLRVAVPERLAREEQRIFVLEAIDISELHRAADLRQAVALFIDLQLRNDLEAIMLGSGLAANPRLDADKLRPVVANIDKTARRATRRLDNVASLVRAENAALVEACYPVDASKILRKVHDRTAALADELGVIVDMVLPGISGFTLAEPHTLTAMIEAMLRVVVADTPRGDTVRVVLEERGATSLIRISGGFGIGFGRLMTLMDTRDDDSVGEYRTISKAMGKVRGWNASVSYWGREADGFGFNVNLKRIG